MNLQARKSDFPFFGEESNLFRVCVRAMLLLHLLPHSLALSLAAFSGTIQLPSIPSLREGRIAIAVVDGEKLMELLPAFPFSSNHSALPLPKQQRCKCCFHPQKRENWKA